MEAGEYSLRTFVQHFDGWLMDAAFPLWWEKGADHRHGGFFESLGQDGSPGDGPRRARVQARQSWAYAMAGAMGWKGDWRPAADHGLTYLAEKYRRPDGQYSTLVSSQGSVLDATALLYDQAFVLLAMAQLFKVFPERGELARSARDLLAVQVAARRRPGGGFIETGERPFLSNPHMHLLESALAWCDADPDAVWEALAAEIVALCLAHLFDPGRGVIHEYYDPDWKPLAGFAGRSVEPGHQFEWAWLLERWGRRQGHRGARQVARTLFETGLRGVDPRRGAAIDEMSDDFTIIRPSARLWHQAERIKAGAVLMAAATGAERARYKTDVVAASRTLWRYLETPVTGLWRDRMTVEGNFIEEPAPASSFYHLICCISVLQQECGDE
jgi:mannose/cellobiose epimerase-like protein (N-acyl-D-glucosamine 2-epimerase family)